MVENVMREQRIEPINLILEINVLPIATMLP